MSTHRKNELRKFGSFQGTFNMISAVSFSVMIYFFLISESSYENPLIFIKSFEILSSVSFFHILVIIQDTFQHHTTTTPNRAGYNIPSRLPQRRNTYLHIYPLTLLFIFHANLQLCGYPAVTDTVVDDRIWWFTRCCIGGVVGSDRGASSETL